MADRNWRVSFALGMVAGVVLAVLMFLVFPDRSLGWVSHDGALITFTDTLANWLIALFSVVAAALLWRTLLATQEMSKDARRIGESQVRAYLEFKSASIVEHPEKPGVLRVALVLRNFGASPARKIQRQWVQYHGEEATPAEAHRHFGELRPMPEMAPGQETTTHFQIDASVISEIREAQEKGSKMQYRCCGVIIYTDIFGYQRKQFFSYKTTPGEDIRPRLLHMDEDGNYGED